MDTNKWPPQESSGVYVKPMMEQLMNCNNSNTNMMNSNSSASIACPNNTHDMIKAPTLERRGMRPPPQNKDHALHCPRCNSTNTKFCYYNNYSLTQPRYFCKTCRRYWTEGGSLRNVPVGGGSRKNKRPLTANNTTTANHLLSSSPSSTLSFLKIPPAADNSNPPPSTITSLHDSHNSQHPRAGQDLNLTYLGLSQFVHHHGPNKSSIDQNSSSSNNNSTTTSSGAALELLRTGIASRGLGLGSYMPMVPAVPTPVSDSGDNSTNSNGGIYSFHHQEYLRPPTLNFGVDHGVGSNNNNNNRFIGGVHLHHHHHHQESGGGGGGGIGEGRMLFPFGEAKQISGGNGVSGGLELDQSTVQQGNNNNNSSGWWNTSSTSNGMLGGGSW